MLIYESMKKQVKAICDSSFESATPTSGIQEGVFSSKSDGNYHYNKKRAFKQQNYQGYQKDSSSKYQKESNCYQKDDISKVVKGDNVDKWGRKKIQRIILEIRPDVRYVNQFIIGLMP